METILAVVFVLVAYWAVNKVIYAHYVMVGDIFYMFMRKAIVGVALGPVCIPIAIIKTLAGNKNK